MTGPDPATGVLRKVHESHAGGPRSVVSPVIPFQRFLDDQREPVWRFLVASVGREDADDCFQETFLAAMSAYPRLRPDSNLRAWVLTIAHRKALDHHRGRGRRAIPVEVVPEVAVHDPPPRDHETWQRVRELPPK